MKEVGAERTGRKVLLESGTPETSREHSIIKDVAQGGEAGGGWREISEEQEWKESHVCIRRAL